MTPSPSDGELADDAVRDLVYGCVSSSDGYEIIAVSAAEDFAEGRLSDYYTDAEHTLIAQAFAAAGLDAGELMESAYELGDGNAAAARTALAAHPTPGLRYDPAFEAFAAW